MDRGARPAAGRDGLGEPPQSACSPVGRCSSRSSRSRWPAPLRFDEGIDWGGPEMVAYLALAGTLFVLAVYGLLLAIGGEVP